MDDSCQNNSNMTGINVSCDVCKKTFKTKSYLKIHKRIHQQHQNQQQKHPRRPLTRFVFIKTHQTRNSCEKQLLRFYLQEKIQNNKAIN